MLFASCARAIAGVFILLLLSACSTPQTMALRDFAPANLPARAELGSVVFFPQEENQCGPASLAMVLNNAGLTTNPELLKDSLYLPDKQGSLQVEMLATTRKHGLLAYLLQPSMQDILLEVAAGNPVVVLQNLGLSWHPVWHYAVVIGYDLGKEEIILRSGSTLRLSLPFSTFEHTWARSHHWAMLALPPAAIAQTASAENHIQSLAALQHSSATSDLLPAYEAAMQRWPESLLAKIAAGNYAYSRGDLHRAEQVFLTATQLHPEAVAAFNNLAQVQGDQGKYDAALQSAKRALELGGPLQAVVRKTLAEIEQKKRAAQEGALK
jgi:tetratricopeptide (TPR) repeat protein